MSDALDLTETPPAEDTKRDDVLPIQDWLDPNDTFWWDENDRDEYDGRGLSYPHPAPTQPSGNMPNRPGERSITQETEGDNMPTLPTVSRVKRSFRTLTASAKRLVTGTMNLVRDIMP